MSFWKGTHAYTSRRVTGPRANPPRTMVWSMIARSASVAPFRTSATRPPAALSPENARRMSRAAVPTGASSSRRRRASTAAATVGARGASARRLIRVASRRTRCARAVPVEDDVPDAAPLLARLDDERVAHERRRLERDVVVPADDQRATLEGGRRDRLVLAAPDVREGDHDVRASARLGDEPREDGRRLLEAEAARVGGPVHARRRLVRDRDDGHAKAPGLLDQDAAEEGDLRRHGLALGAPDVARQERERRRLRERLERLHAVRELVVPVLSVDLHQAPCACSPCHDADRCGVVARQANNRRITFAGFGNELGRA